mmetsp:Transcript_20833/g.25261  ORF Transcript_20833/g.25261 Transcript_20833/m.25261 type:complete len:198 (-) Transcript_20833:1214-1807(-)|eukprot:CAMPEP_0204830836 /NCGR_PEP_ID=MMETSP1346-20131115/9357_1 /ASSEMBLY_ACC=CAM_ASM_000771 /TAXON_ID=215587 /ORGANISM="Aplanochytrium stocchinoi, Strain GSBS06" /LENGTH=197 /DNA_ID=CAMNT_0051961411 /DNA_START=265 /DNA_END=858 /DNA_ORIENTATION=+
MSLLKFSRGVISPVIRRQRNQFSLTRTFTQTAGGSLHTESHIEETKVRDILKVKDKWRHMWTVDENETVFEATRKMVEYKTGSLCVTRDGKVVGIVTERDYLRKVVHEGRTSADTKVGEISTLGNKLICASPDDTLQDCVDIMTIKDIRHIPVTENDGEVVGLLSIKDIARAFSQERDRVFRTLDDIRDRQMPIHDG